MGFIKDLTDPVKGFGVTFGTMFEKPTTEQYPEEKKETAKRFHGRHQLNRHPDGLEKCVGCELCAWACPADAIFVEGADNTDEERFSPGERYGRVYQINYLRCILCGLCVEACPTRALTMLNDYELADDSRTDLIFTKEQLLAPLAEGMEQPPHPMRLGDDETAYYVRDGATLASPPAAGEPVGTTMAREERDVAATTDAVTATAAEGPRSPAAESGTDAVAPVTGEDAAAGPAGQQGEAGEVIGRRTAGEHSRADEAPAKGTGEERPR